MRVQTHRWSCLKQFHIRIDNETPFTGEGFENFCFKNAASNRMAERAIQGVKLGSKKVGNQTLSPPIKLSYIYIYIYMRTRSKKQPSFTFFTPICSLNVSSLKGVEEQQIVLVEYSRIKPVMVPPSP